MKGDSGHYCFECAESKGFTWTRYALCQRASPRALREALHDEPGPGIAPGPPAGQPPVDREDPHVAPPPGAPPEVMVDLANVNTSVPRDLTQIHPLPEILPTTAGGLLAVFIGDRSGAEIRNADAAAGAAPQSVGVNAAVSLSRSSSSSSAAETGPATVSPAAVPEPAAPAPNEITPNSETPTVLYNERLPPSTAADVGLEVEEEQVWQSLDADLMDDDISSIIELPAHDSAVGAASDAATDGGSQAGTREHVRSHVVLNVNDEQVISEPAQAPIPVATATSVLPPIPPAPERHETARPPKARRCGDGTHMLLSHQIEGYEFNTLHPRTRNLITAFDRVGICPGCARWSQGSMRYVKTGIINHNTVQRMALHSDVPTHCCSNCMNRDRVSMDLDQLRGTKADCAYWYGHTAKWIEIREQVGWLYRDDHERYDHAITLLPGGSRSVT